MGATKSEILGGPTGQLFRGERIGRYEILTQLSVGGMAELFLAFTQGPGGFRKFVVIKRILPDAQSNESFVRMFLDEARITAALSHPNIGQVFELGGEGGGESLYLAMEFLPGQNLNQITAACLQQKRRLPVGFSIAVVRDVLTALHYAHTFVDSRGQKSPVIHRDVAQKNVMVTYDGQVKLLDFGIAKAQNSLGKTTVGMVKGTTGYMSPEQVRGEELDGRSDVFSAGILLFEILTGKRLFSAQTEAEEMERILSAPIPDASAVDPTLPGKLAAVVNKALARDRDQRFPTARAMARALEQAAAPILYDQEQTAAFMTELFEQKMAATRALLETAGENEHTQIREAGSLLRRDLGSVFPGEQVAEGLPALKESPKREAAKQVAGPNLHLPMAKTELASPEELEPLFVPVARTQVDPELRPPPKKRPGPKPSRPSKAAPVIGGVAVVIVLGTIGWWAQREAETTVAANAPALTAGLPVRSDFNPATQGLLSLQTDPPSAVSAGATALGQTPLREVPLKAGTHLLSVIGPKGERRILTVTIQAGKTTQVRVDLDDLPSSAILKVE